MGKIEAKINGRIYGGWKECDVRRSMKTMSGSFGLSITDRWSAQSKPWPILRGDECQILINGNPVITGFVDDVDLEIGPTSKSIAITGRDKTCDLVDCSADIPQSQFNKINLTTIAQTLASKFGINVVTEATVGAAIENATMQVGESVFEFLDKLARTRGVLLTSDGLGNLVITRPGTSRSRTALVLGQNMISGSKKDSGSDRFSAYKVKAQANLGMQIQNTPETDFVVQGTAKDLGVKRYRPKVIQSEANATNAEAIVRAQWEAKTRASRGEIASAVVRGWTQSDGSLWRPNQIVKVSAQWLNLSEERLISEVTYKLSSSGGSVSTLTLDRTDSFLPEPEVKEKGGLGALIRQDRTGAT